VTLPPAELTVAVAPWGTTIVWLAARVWPGVAETIVSPGPETMTLPFMLTSETEAGSCAYAGAAKARRDTRARA
jgi:hypothetical protein